MRLIAIVIAASPAASGFALVADVELDLARD